MLDFMKFKFAINTNFQNLSKHGLLRSSIEKDVLWSCYLESFPTGSNPIFRKKAEYDCSCCKQFIRTAGDAVAIVDGKFTSLWDVVVDEPAYQAVANALANLVRSRPIQNKFLHYEGKIGTDKNREDGPNGVLTWPHFSVQLSNSLVCKKDRIGPTLSDVLADHDVLLRSLSELTLDAVTTVQDLIKQGSLYRGDEKKRAIDLFREILIEFGRIAPESKDHYVWDKLGGLPGEITRIRNTAIGVLLVDLSEGLDLEGSVRKFEAVVAPMNYKRPTALVTPTMVAKAKATVEELGLTSALDRRYAKLTDLNINDLFFADRNTKQVLKGGAFDDLPTAAIKPRALDRVEEVTIGKFLSEIIPTCNEVEVLLENRHTGNLVSLVAPTDPTSKPLFKWPNRFSWSYRGDLADSVKERVKKAGGNVSGDLCLRLGWYNYDDLDLHLIEPNGSHIYYGIKRAPSGGQLDVDMNVPPGQSREPVENIVYAKASMLREGSYHLYVNQFTKRDRTDLGFEVEMDFMGDLHRFVHENDVRARQNVTVVKFTYSKKNGIVITEALPNTLVSKQVWGLSTETYHKVSAILLSPNYWGEVGAGNKHYLVMLDGCQNDGTARGFYNEFLTGELDQHRKVLELVGAKMRTDETKDQLSGLGFSSTQRNHLVVKVKGAFTRTLKVIF